MWVAEQLPIPLDHVFTAGGTWLSDLLRLDGSGQFTNKHVLECKILNNLPPTKFRSSLSTTRTTQKNVGNSNVWIHGLLPGYTHLQVNHEKTLITFNYTGWYIGILIMAYYNPYIVG